MEKINGLRRSISLMSQSGDFTRAKGKEVMCNPLLEPQLFDLVEAAAAKKEVPKRVVTQEGAYEQSQAAAKLPKRQY